MFSDEEGGGELVDHVALTEVSVPLTSQHLVPE